MFDNDQYPPISVFNLHPLTNFAIYQTNQNLPIARFRPRRTSKTQLFRCVPTFCLNNIAGFVFTKDKFSSGVRAILCSSRQGEWSLDQSFPSTSVCHDMQTSCMGLLWLTWGIGIRERMRVYICKDEHESEKRLDRRRDVNCGGEWACMRRFSWYQEAWRE